jgi:hypothetical protein
MNTKPVGELLRDIMADNMDNFRVFGPDENTSNKLDAVYEVSKKLWLTVFPCWVATGSFFGHPCFRLLLPFSQGKGWTFTSWLTMMPVTPRLRHNLIRYKKTSSHLWYFLSHNSQPGHSTPVENLRHIILRKA